MHQLLNIVEDTRSAWRHGSPWGHNNSLGGTPSKLYELGIVSSPTLPYGPDDSLREDQALAIFAYTLETPSVYVSMNRAMFDREARSPSGPAVDKLQSWLKFIKFLNAALTNLPESFIFRTSDTGSPCYRGVKHVFPGYPGGPDPMRQEHNPVAHYPAESFICWYQFCSTSYDRSVMDNSQFCGHRPGPRTIFVVHVHCGYRIEALSWYGLAEKEVLLPPLSEFQVKGEALKLCNPSASVSLDQGFPDVIQLRQLPSAESLQHQIESLQRQLRAIPSEIWRQDSFRCALIEGGPNILIERGPDSLRLPKSIAKNLRCHWPRLVQAFKDQRCVFVIAELSSEHDGRVHLTAAE